VNLLVVAAIVIAIVGVLDFILLRSRAAPNASSVQFKGNSWRPVEIGGCSIPDGSGMSVDFEADGGIRGHGGCNGFFGSYEESDDGLRIGPLGATQMACPEPAMGREIAFMTALQQTRHIGGSQTQMTFLDADRNLLATLVPNG